MALSTLPNQLTLFRVFIIPMIVVIYYSPLEWRFIASAALFGLAGITDALDGHIARKYDLSTPLGAFLDPVADKLLVAVALAILIDIHHSVWFTMPAAVIICREIVISALREWMAEVGSRAKVAVSNLGKIKTTIQIIAIVVLLIFPPFAAWPFAGLWEYKMWANYFGIFLLYIAAVLTIWSMFSYLKAAWPSLMSKDL